MSDIFEEYEEIVQLREDRGIWLVLDKKCKKVFIKKYRQNFDPDVYETISRIQDPHIPKIFKCQETEGILCIIEEYIPGETLQEMMDRGYIFSRDEITKIMLQLCDALECLHIRFHPIIHRDIKPSNIVISGDGILKLIDYNAARRYEKEAMRDTRYMGTPGYAAPEQYGFFQSDVRTDIYAMGVVLNYMLTGRHISEETASGGLGRIVKRCTQLDPGKRYDSVTDVKKDFQKIIRKQRLFLRQGRNGDV